MFRYFRFNYFLFLLNGKWVFDRNIIKCSLRIIIRIFAWLFILSYRILFSFFFLWLLNLCNDFILIRISWGFFFVLILTWVWVSMTSNLHSIRDYNWHVIQRSLRLYHHLRRFFNYFWCNFFLGFKIWVKYHALFFIIYFWPW